MSDDASVVGNDQQSVQYDDPSSDITGLANLGPQIQSDFAIYQSAQSQLPNYVPSSVPTSAMIQNALNAIQNDLNADKTTGSQDLAKAQQLFNQAQADVTTANQVASAH